MKSDERLRRAGEIIANARCRCDATQNQVSFNAGCSPSTISQLEQGKFENPSKELLAGIAHDLGLDWDIFSAMYGYLPDDISVMAFQDEKLLKEVYGFLRRMVDGAPK